MPLMMLRAGASEVVAIEFTPQIAEFARFNAQVLSCGASALQNWTSSRPTCACFSRRISDPSMLSPHSARCTAQADMARVIRTAASMGATLVVQANEAIDNLPAKARDLEPLLRHNGYDLWRSTRPLGFLDRC